MSTTSSSRARSSKKRKPSTRPKTSSMARRAVTSCPRSPPTAQGRRGWLREAKQRLEAERAADTQPVPRSRPQRLREAKRRLEEELWIDVRANQAYEAYRARGRMKDGRRLGRPPDPYQPPATP